MAEVLQAGGTRLEEELYEIMYNILRKNRQVSGKTGAPHNKFWYFASWQKKRGEKIYQSSTAS